MDQSDNTKFKSMPTSAVSTEEAKTALEEENVFLKDQVVRLNKELSHYQHSQQNAGIRPSSTLSSSDYHHHHHHSGVDIDLPESITDSKVISPLLTVYDHRIEELSTFIERQGSALDALTQRSNDLLSENENLRSRIIQGLKTTLSPSDSRQAQTLTMTVGNSDKKQEAEGQVKQLLSDKHLLEEQAELLVKEVLNANQTIASRDKSISSLTEQVGNKLKLIKELNQMIQRLTKEKGNCEKELVSRIGCLATQTNEIKRLKQCIDELKKEHSNVSSIAEVAGMDKHYLEAENESLATKVRISTNIDIHQRNTI
jgi:chromosome segregation ATPase